MLYTLFFHKNQEMSAEARMFLNLIHILKFWPNPNLKYMLRVLLLKK